MIFSPYRVTKNPEDLVKGLLSPSYTERTYTYGVSDAPTATGTVIYPIGVVDEPGKILQRMWVASGITSGLNATDYYTFKGWVAEPGGTKVYLRSTRGTNLYALNAAQGFVIHDEDTLGLKLQVGSVLGVDIVIINGGTLTDPGTLLLQASVIYGG